ncbi:MAG TPA: hypothetical protein VIM10_08460 [Actinopolymorphaceae bacterium]
MDIDRVADELYALPPEDFIGARTALEKEAKAAGAKELAVAIHQLGRPNLVAWLANQLVRERGDEVRPLLELGAALREATATLSGPDLRELSRQQYQVVYALVQQAKALARAAGRKVSPDTERGLQDSLHAALADEAAADLLLAGRLTTSLQRIGFPGDPAPTAAPRAGTPTRARSKPGTVTTQEELAERRRAAELERARQSEAAARTAAKSAKVLAEQADAALTKADERLAAALARVEELRSELDRATSAYEAAEGNRSAAREQAQNAGQVSAEADTELEQATTHRRQLEDGAG